MIHPTKTIVSPTFAKQSLTAVLLAALVAMPATMSHAQTTSTSAETLSKFESFKASFGSQSTLLTAGAQATGGEGSSISTSFTDDSASATAHAQGDGSEPVEASASASAQGSPGGTASADASASASGSGSSQASAEAQASASGSTSAQASASASASGSGSSATASASASSSGSGSSSATASASASSSGSSSSASASASASASSSGSASAQASASAGGGIPEGDACLTDLDPVTLTATLRDFNMSHPDMEYEQKSFGLRRGMVKNELDAEGKPVLSTLYSRIPWRAMVDSSESFSQWFRNIPGVNQTDTFNLVLEQHPEKPGVLVYAREIQNGQLFFPANGRGFNETHTTRYGTHNYHFTVELDTEFTYTAPSTRCHPLEFAFSGDDDVWVFINGQLAVDLGGVHGQESAMINLDQYATQFGLEAGNNYPLKLFFAERHTSLSNFRVETTIGLRSNAPSVITPTFD